MFDIHGGFLIIFWSETPQKHTHAFTKTEAIVSQMQISFTKVFKPHFQ